MSAVMAVAPLLAFGPAERAAGTRWALVIGISDYIHFDDVEGGDLPGAEHDARAVRDVLIMREHVPPENIRLLLNTEATRDAIEEGITGWLVDNARPGDNVVIFFAGHGSQMWDESGDESDGLDETIAPADVLATSTQHDISDDTFNEWLGALPTDNVVVILDNCNSGTGTRDVTPFSRGRLLARDLDAIERPAAVARRALPGQATDETGFDVGRTRVLELAAAQPNQVAVDAYFPATGGAEAFHGGAFTTFLVRQLWKAPVDMTYQEVFEEAYEALKRNRFQQDPYISTDVAMKDRPLFFVAGEPGGSSQVSLPVSSVAGATAELGAGVALGITPGSVFTTDSGARLEVEAVAQRGTRVRVAEGSVRTGDQARLTAHRYAATPLLVNVAGIDSRLAGDLRAALAGSPDVTLVEREEEFSHLIVRRRGEELRVVGSDGFARHDGISVAAGGPERLAAALRKEAAAKRLGDMDNPAQPFGLKLELMDGRTTFGLGQSINFSIESQHDGYLTLVDLGTDGTVTVLVPNVDDPSMPVRAGRVLTYPAERGVYFEAQPPAGGGMVRAFVTTEPLRLPVPPGEAAVSGGAELAAQVAAELRRIAGTEGDAVRLDTWATAAVVYEIHN